MFIFLYQLDKYTFQFLGEYNSIKKFKGKEKVLKEKGK